MLFVNEYFNRIIWRDVELDDKQRIEKENIDNNNEYEKNKNNMN